jgi:hypothetical protein
MEPATSMVASNRPSRCWKAGAGSLPGDFSNGVTLRLMRGPLLR